MNKVRYKSSKFLGHLDEAVKIYPKLNNEDLKVKGSLNSIQKVVVCWLLVRRFSDFWFWFNLLYLLGSDFGVH